MRNMFASSVITMHIKSSSNGGTLWQPLGIRTVPRSPSVLQDVRDLRRAADPRRAHVDHFVLGEGARV